MGAAPPPPPPGRALDECLCVTVADDGVGFTDTAALTGVHGSANMTARMAQIGGTFERRSVPGQGTEVVLAINLPGISGVECVKQLSQVMPAAQVIMITVYDDSDSIFESLAAGASGYLLKPVQSAQLLEAIEEVRSGGAPMSMGKARRVVPSGITNNL